MDNDIQQNQKNMKEAVILKIWSVYLLIMVDILFLRPSLYFTTLYYTCRHFTSSLLNFTHLHFTTLHYPFIWFKPISISCHSISPHITTLHLASLHCIFRRFSPQFYSFRFIPPIIAFLNLFLRILGFQGKVHEQLSLWFPVYSMDML